jgi:hypothetical protein
MMRTFRDPFAVGLIVLFLLAGVLWLAAGPTGADDESGATFSPADRQALGAAPVERGPEAGGPDPAVDLTDPVAVARAYVTAGYGLRDTDAGHTNRRAVPYAAPGSPPATVGVLVVAAPPAGRSAVVTVTGVEQVNGEPTGTRRGYVVAYRTDLDPTPRSRYLVLVRQIDGDWLVGGDSPDGQVGEP